jgi:hypothetical protein
VTVIAIGRKVLGTLVGYYTVGQMDRYTPILYILLYDVRIKTLAYNKVQPTIQIFTPYYHFRLENGTTSVAAFIEGGATLHTSSIINFTRDHTEALLSCNQKEQKDNEESKRWEGEYLRWKRRAEVRVEVQIKRCWHDTL